MIARDHKLRVFIIFVTFSVLFVILVVRLFLIQVRQKQFFKDLAQQQYEFELTLNPARAGIYDRSGTFPLAFNRNMWSAFILPKQFTEGPKTTAFLKRTYPDVYNRMKKHPEKHFWWVERKLTPKKYKDLVGRDLKDIQFIGEFSRFYPCTAASQIVGFTDIDNQGTAGIELEFSQRLAGVPTNITIEKDARSGLFYFEKMIQKHGQLGKSLTLTLDSMLQAYAFDELARQVKDLKAKAGSVLVINPDNGQILTMTNYPVFDPNQKGVSSLEMMKNNLVCECYELGSVLKALCAMAAFEEGLVEIDEIIDCEGRVAYIDGVRVENATIGLAKALEDNDNKLPFYDVIRYSSNVGIAKVAKRLGPKFYTHLRRLGFGDKTGIEFPGERSGYLNHPARWSKPTIIVMSFGYEMMVSLLQLTKAFCVIANGGYDVQPTLVKDDTVKKGKRLYSEKTIATMKELLTKVCERKCAIPGISVMGKTGTARCMKNGRYSTLDHIYTFAGIIEKGDYRRVIVTFVKEPEKSHLWASQVAMPLFFSLAKRMVVHDKIHGVLT